MPTNSFVFPASGQGFARDACLTTLANPTSGLSFLGTGTYEPYGIYISDGGSLLPIAGSVPFPTLFGSWIYTLLGGELPTQQSGGGVDYIGGGYGGVAWVPIAYTGSEGMQLQINFGGMLAYDSALPTLNYTVTGTELFGVEYQVLDNLPQQIEIQFYESTLGWHKVWIGDADHFALGGTNKGTIPPITNHWVSFTFTPADLGLTPGMVITGMAWGVWISGSTSNVVFSDTTNLNSGSTPIPKIPGGFIDCDQDGVSGFYILAHTGPLVDVPSIGGLPVSIPLATSPSYDYTGLCYNTAYSAPYFIGYDGTIYNYSSGIVNTITSIPSGAVAPARQLFTDGSNLYTSFPASNKVGKYSISGHTWTLTTSPFGSFLDTIYYSSSIGKVIAGGRNTLDLSDASTIRGMTWASNSNQLLVTDSSDSIKVYNYLGGNWSLNQTVSGTGAASGIAVEPDGLEALVTDTTNNLVQVLSYVSGTWEQIGTVSVTAPTAITIVSSGVVQALVCQPTHNTLSIVNKSLPSWEVVQTFSIAGVNSIAVNTVNNSIQGIATSSTGVVFMTFNGADWTLNSAIPLSPVPTLTAVDSVNTSNPYFYAAASSGGTTTIYVFQNQSLIGGYTFSGTIGALNVVNYQVIVPTVSGAINVGYYIGGVTNNVVNSAASPASGFQTLWIPEIVSNPVLLVAGPHDIWSFYNDAPQAFNRITDSLIAVLTGSSWNTIDLENQNKVASITSDSSGNIFTVTTDNDIYKIQSQTTIASGYPYSIVPPVNQENGVPLGLSKLQMFNGNLVSSSSLMGGLVIINNL